MLRELLSYMKVHRKMGGPVDSIQYFPIEISPEKRGFEARVQLCEGIKKNPRPKFAMYGNVDGTGAAPDPLNASLKAVSEALERWAFFDTLHDSNAKTYGFVDEPTSSGMAAFPKFKKDQARGNAYYEAVERWSLVEWWREQLPCRILNPTAVEILSPWRETKVILLRKPTPAGQVYGFAAGPTRESAQQRAGVELLRNQRVLNYYHRLAEKPSEISWIEKRLLHYASSKGVSEFDQKIESSSKLILRTPRPRTIVDREIPGPWSKYAQCWRVLFESEDRSYLDSDTQYFWF